MIDNKLVKSSLTHKKVFARNLEVWLFCKNITPLKLAELMLVSPNTLYRLQKGELSTINFDTLDKLSEATGLPVSFFFQAQPDIVYK